MQVPILQLQVGAPSSLHGLRSTGTLCAMDGWLAGWMDGWKEGSKEKGRTGGVGWVGGCLCLCVFLCVHVYVFVCFDFRVPSKVGPEGNQYTPIVLHPFGGGFL